MSSIALNSEGNITPTQHVMVDYVNLPFRCRACHRWNHLIKNYNKIQRPRHIGPRRYRATHQTYAPEKNKGPVVDGDVFQKANIKPTMRNIFEMEPEDMREALGATVKK